MMVDIGRCRDDAKRRVKRRYGDWIAVTGESQTDDSFVFSLGSADGDRTLTANLEMHVYDKETGTHHEVRLPSKEGFEIIRSERPIEA
ncbi:MAG: hypothetical protein ACI362_04410 [Coriobacteriales bacterium]